MRIVLACVAVLTATPLAALADEAGSALAATCAMCHGTSGHSVGGNVPLAGMPKDEMVSKFKAFRSGAMQATVMDQIAKGYSDAQLEQLAAFFAAQKK